jgi:hypothetical protein
MGLPQQKREAPRRDDTSPLMRLAHVKKWSNSTTFRVITYSVGYAKSSPELIKRSQVFIHFLAGHYLAATGLELLLLQSAAHVVGDEGAGQVVLVELLTKQYAVGHTAR